MRIVLGSSSPRRKEILTPLIGSFEIIAPDIDEKVRSGETPQSFANRVSYEKALSVLKQYDCNNEVLIITSDTIVTHKGRIMGKPKDYDDACRMLQFLSNNTHYVISSITLLHLLHQHKAPASLTDSCSTAVTFKNLNMENIASYLASTHYTDKAGSYALQENGEQIIHSVNGSASNVIGFPISLFIQMTHKLGVTEILY